MDDILFLENPEMLEGLQELLGDTDLAVVKRTIRVFTNIYRQGLEKLTDGTLDENIMNNSWPAIKSLVNKLLDKAKTCENQGVLLQIMKFLESALTSHLSLDASRFPPVAEQGRYVVKRGLMALKTVVTTPYVGGCTYIVAVRCLVTIACLRDDLWQPVTGLLQKQIASPPPSLFDHNVRSLHKVLQFSLLRLLRLSNTPSLKETLVEMLVSVGYPRRLLTQWVPPAESKKRLAPPPVVHDDDVILGHRSPPPSKRSCTGLVSTIAIPKLSKEAEEVKNNSESSSSSLTESNKNFVFNKLNLQMTVKLVLNTLEKSPDTIESIIKFCKESNVPQDICSLRSNIALQMCKQFTAEQFAILQSKEDKMQKDDQNKQQMDIDLRKTIPKATKSSSALFQDVDMRIPAVSQYSDPRIQRKLEDLRIKNKNSDNFDPPKDPRIGKNISPTGSQSTISQSYSKTFDLNHRDPRLDIGKIRKADTMSSINDVHSSYPSQSTAAADNGNYSYNVISNNTDHDHRPSHYDVANKEEYSKDKGPNNMEIANSNSNNIYQRFTKNSLTLVTSEGNQLNPKDLRSDKRTTDGHIITTSGNMVGLPFASAGSFGTLAPPPFFLTPSNAPGFAFPTNAPLLPSPQLSFPQRPPVLLSQYKGNPLISFQGQSSSPIQQSPPTLFVAASPNITVKYPL